MGKIEELEPRSVFRYFNELTKIPRGSGHEKAVSDRLVEFASKRGLIAYQDQLNNVTILKPATSGMEDKETVILQAHMDMVCVADDASADMTKTPIKPCIDGDYIKAEGTSLGADDGIGVAFILAILDSEDISHPMLEAVFTTGEEVGLGGAIGYDCSRIKGTRFINLDSEVENEIVVGCAGGCRCEISSKCKNTKTEGNIYEVTISGLTGGHSGTDIEKGTANANVLMGRLLDMASASVEMALGSYKGGTKDNAICPAASATIVVRKKQGKAFEKCVKSFTDDIIAEYHLTDPDINIKCKDKGKGSLEVIKNKDLIRFISILNILPNGVIRMNKGLDGEQMTETSANIGVVNVNPKGFEIVVSLRSNREPALEWMISKVTKIAECFDIVPVLRGRYPAWEYHDSDFKQKARELYEKMFDRKASVVTIHAGLECAVFSKKIKGMDAISIGPDMEGVHSTAENLSISSTGRIWEYLLELLKL